MDTAQQTAFFDSLVNQLHESGVLRTYATPLGQPKPELFEAKDAHSLPEKNMAGLVQHIGDQPYSKNMVGLIPFLKSNYRRMPVTPDDVRLTVASARKALDHFVPEERFAEYLRFFTQNLQLPEHQQALQRAMEGVYSQLGFSEPRQKMSPDEFESMLGGNQKAQHVRYNLRRSPQLPEAVDHPELVLSLAIYQAAHRAYADQLAAAIERNENLSTDEKDNGLMVVNNGPINQFRSFLIFETMIPLTLHARKHLDVPEGTSREEAMEKSITAAWGIFFEKKILTTDFSDEQIEPDANKTQTRMTCPAMHHLQTTRNQGALEEIYRYVTNHRAELGNELDAAQEAMAMAAGVPIPPKPRMTLSQSLLKTFGGGEHSTGSNFGI